MIDTDEVKSGDLLREAIEKRSKVDEKTDPTWRIELEVMKFITGPGGEDKVMSEIRSVLPSGRGAPKTTHAALASLQTLAKAPWLRFISRSAQVCLWEGLLTVENPTYDVN